MNLKILAISYLLHPLSPYFADFSVPTPQSRKFYFAPYCGLKRLYCADCATQFSLGPPSEPFCVVLHPGAIDFANSDLCSYNILKILMSHFCAVYIWRAVHPRVAPFRAIIKFIALCAVLRRFPQGIKICEPLDGNPDSGSGSVDVYNITSDNTLWHISRSVSSISQTRRWFVPPIFCLLRDLVFSIPPDRSIALVGCGSELSRDYNYY